MELTKTDNWIFNNYPIISQRKVSISSIADTLNDTNSLVLIDKQLGDGVALRWVKAQLLDVLRICGAGNVFNEIQVIFTARRIRTIYYYLTLSELTYFFESFIGGRYGALYVGKSINPQNIFEAIKLFENERCAKIDEIEASIRAEQLRKEKEEIKKGNTGLQAWLKYSQQHNSNEKMPLEGFLKELKRKKFNIKR